MLIGDGERRAELEAYAARVGARAIFAGWETDLKSVYAALDVVCLTSFNEGSAAAMA
ncbi:MAG TPA: glycosyltransferase [Chloroflexota bacterium]|nr:glycosyltransferase [Chloroflexota bacterium]